MQIPLAFFVGAPGGGELLLIFVIILLMYGPKRLPEMARHFGKAMEYLRKTSSEFREQVMRLDEEIPKTLEAHLSDSPASADNPVSDHLESPMADTDGNPDSQDPYQTYEDYNYNVDASEPKDVVNATPQAEDSTPADKVTKEENGQTDQVASGSPEHIPGAESQGDVPKD